MGASGSCCIGHPHIDGEGPSLVQPPHRRLLAQQLQESSWSEDDILGLTYGFGGGDGATGSSSRLPGIGDADDEEGGRSVEGGSRPWPFARAGGGQQYVQMQMQPRAENGAEVYMQPWAEGEQYAALEQRAWDERGGACGGPARMAMVSTSRGRCFGAVLTLAVIAAFCVCGPSYTAVMSACQAARPTTTLPPSRIALGLSIEGEAGDGSGGFDCAGTDWSWSAEQRSWCCDRRPQQRW
mmetsp:Transcript_51208/g.164469  ORF Transcript_51208/g.164469 Transcript_51208/m.164469 type:complete len:239 (+) Transcript_51208:87-803(+)